MDMYFDIKKEDLRDTAGFSFDIGGSCAKIAYVDEACDVSDKQSNDTLRVRFKIFPRDNVEEIVNFLKPKLSHEAAPKEIFASGFGSLTHKEKLESMLNVRLVIKNELDGFAKATKYLLENYPRDVTFTRTTAGVTDEVRKMLEAFADSPFTKLGDEDQKLDPPEPEKEQKRKVIVQNFNLVDSDRSEQCLPCLVCMCGSGNGLYTVNEKGKFLLCDGTLTGGRWFVNLCKLILGTSDFDEIMTLAEMGDQKNVDLFGNHVKEDISDCPEAKIYTTFPDDMVLFFLGKVADHTGDDYSSFKKEDLAASLLRAQCFSIAQLAQIIAKKAGVNKILFCGGFLSHPFAANCLEEAILARLHFELNNKTRYGFMKCGSSYGALGLLLK